VVWSDPERGCSAHFSDSQRGKEHERANVKLVVIYKRPKDIDAFEKVHQNEHVPLAVRKLDGKTKIVATKVVASPQRTPPLYRIAAVHFPSMKDLEGCAASDAGKQVLAHAVSISSGAPPILGEPKKRASRSPRRRAVRSEDARGPIAGRSSVLVLAEAEQVKSPVVRLRILQRQLRLGWFPGTHT
jgi:uncharacterized protein (TIGR02118 family)